MLNIFSIFSRLNIQLILLNVTENGPIYKSIRVEITKVVTQIPCT